MPFRPSNTNHAIESAGFGIQFSRLLNQAEWQAIHEHHQKWVHILPAVQFENDANPVAFFGFLQPDGTDSWKMNVGKNLIVVTCSQYTRWHNVKEQVLELFKLISEVLLDVPESDLSVQSIIFEMHDVFIHDGKGDYKLNSLFVEKSPKLLDGLFESGQHWKQHTNFIIKSSSNEQHLEEIKLNSGHWNNSDAALVVHHQEFIFDDAIMLQSLVEEKAQKLSSKLEKMHKGNKDLLQEILVKQMQKEIFLNVEVG